MRKTSQKALRNPGDPGAVTAAAGDTSDELAQLAIRPRLLLVEDDQELVTLLTRVLQDAGYAVDAARDGQAGLHLALTRPFEVMIIDRGLPAIDGVDLI